MAQELTLTRRAVVCAGAATVGSIAVADLFMTAEALATTGPRGGIEYFARFGVTEKLIRDAISVALSKGGEYADVFFQHRVTNSMALEDGAVNRAVANVALGVGVRVVKGDQTGYGFTEDLTPEGLRRAALTAAAIAQGPSRAAPTSFHAMDERPNRYPNTRELGRCTPTAETRAIDGTQ